MHIKYQLSDTGSSSEYYYNKLYDRLASLLEQRANQLSQYPKTLTILDVGCGRGEILKRMSDKGFFNLVGIDPDAKCVELSSNYAEVYHCSVQDIASQLPKREFDLAVCSHVLEHLETPRQLLNELKTLPVRELVLAVPNLGNPFKYRKRVDYENRGHVCGWDSTHLNTLLSTSGWPVDHWEEDMVLLPERLRRKLPRFIRHGIEETHLPRAHKFVFAQSLICVGKNTDDH